MFFLAVTGNAVPAHPCSRGISASLHVIDVRHFGPQNGQAQEPLIKGVRALLIIELDNDSKPHVYEWTSTAQQ
jgi:hypothetical protein